jgi:hypothetical protein
MRREQRVSWVDSVFRLIHITHHLAQSTAYTQAGTASVLLPRDPRRLRGKQAEK